MTGVPVTNRRDRGASIAEYAVLWSGVAIMLMISLQVLGGTVEGVFAVVNEELADNKIAVDEDGGTLAICPPGWDLIANNQTKKNGQDVDANNDGMICRKQIPGGGKGNTNLNQNVKDNNG